MRHHPARMVAGGTGRLLEREIALDALEALVAGTATGGGGAIVLEASAGLGKSRLVAVARRLAGAAGIRVLFARGGELEQELPWGAASAMLARAVEALPAPEREALAAGPAAAVLGLGDWLPAPSPAPGAVSGDGALLVAHALFSAVDRIGRAGPLLIVLDDAHWSDAATLRFLLYLLNRLDELPLALLVAGRPREAGPVAPLLERIVLHPVMQRLALRPLTAAAVQELAGDRLGAEPGAGLAVRLHELTAGNPFYVHELLRTLDGAGPGAISSEPIARMVLLRISRVGTDALALARAVAVLGRGAPLRLAVALAGVGLDDGRRAADALAAAEILAPGEPLAFVHPLVADAVHGDLPAGERAAAHRRAASALADEGAPPEAVAAHLLLTSPLGDAWAVDRLRAAGAHALEHVDAETAVRFLRRALDEPPGRGAPRAEVLVALGRAEAIAGEPAAAEHLAAALEWLDQPRPRAEVRRELGRVLFTSGRGREAAAVLVAGREELRAAGVDGELAQELRATFLSVALFDVELRAEVDGELEAVIASGEIGATPAERSLLAQLAFQRCLTAAPRGQVRRLCERAWGDGALLADEGADGLSWPLVNGALYWIGDLERELELLERVRDDAHRRGSPLAFASVSWCMGPPLLQRGAVDEALEQVALALDARRYGWARHLASLHRLHARCLIEQGDLDGAAATLDALDAEPGLVNSGEQSVLLEIRGRLRLLRGDPAGALEHLLEAGRVAESTMQARQPTVIPWRSTAALALSALGETERALALVEDELESARGSEVARAQARALRVRGLLEGGERGIATLEAAVAVLDGVGPRLERTETLVELGAALRRAGRRVDAREPLRAALDAAHRGGASALAERARVELGAAGARPRSDALSGAEALTPSERRVASMAAQGMTNGEIAQALFVTVKTVEWHLRGAFRKLGVRGRHELAAVLAPG